MSTMEVGVITWTITTTFTMISMATSLTTMNTNTGVGHLMETTALTIRI